MTFNNLYAAVLSVLASKRGAAMVEYALLAGLIAVVAITALTNIGTAVNTSFGSLATKI